MKEQQVITDEFIKRGTSDRGGWSKRQLACLGVDWPPLKGWKHRIIGTVIPAEDADRFLSLAKRKSHPGQLGLSKEMRSRRL